MNRLATAMFVVAVVAVSPLLGGRAHAAVVLNEVLYDPSGDDTGAEFVEIWNSGDLPEVLAGVRIEAGDGARPGSWEVIFTASVADTVPAHGCLLVAASRLTGAMQNGPDAVRLTRDGVVLDRVGWGLLDAAEFMEGRPAIDVASGLGLSRRGDGIDTDDNAADWEPSAPTPGAANHPPYRIVLSRPRMHPEVSWPGDPVTVEIDAKHAGRTALGAGEWSIVLAIRPRTAAGTGSDEGSPPGIWRDCAQWNGRPLASGESLHVSLTWDAVDAGPFDLRATAWTKPDTESETQRVGWVARDSTLLMGRVTAGPVVINEIAFHDDGAGEWVEVEAVEAIAAWSDYALGDASGAPHRLVSHGGDAGAAVGSLRVVADDPARFAARFAIPESLLLTTEGTWPSLNDTASPGSAAAPYAEIVRVGGSDGAPCDVVPYFEDAVARGASLERLSVRFPSAAGATWTESVSPSGGTPGAPNSVLAFAGERPAPPGLLAAPARVLRRAGLGGRGALVFELGMGVVDRSVRLSILDLRGRVRRRLATGERFGGVSALVWDGLDDEGRAVEPGLYVAILEASSAGQASRRASVAVAVAGARGRSR